MHRLEYTTTTFSYSDSGAAQANRYAQSNFVIFIQCIKINMHRSITDGMEFSFFQEGLVCFPIDFKLNNLTLAYR